MYATLIVLTVGTGASGSCANWWTGNCFFEAVQWLDMDATTIRA
ncbi:hypothetical protein H4V99_001895 [Cryobacterium sp. CG_9.6]|nr:hypothetical protein [Cryobacterium sp. CG_9.6]